MDFDALKQRLHTARPDLQLLEWEPMSRHTSFRIGGPVRLMVCVTDEADLTAALTCASACGVSPFLLGNGTNVLAADGEIDAFVILTAGGLDRLERTGGNEITCGAGVPLSRLSAFAAERGLSGLEFAQGIPGTLGGGLAMNAGAYGGELKDVTVKSYYLTSDGIPGVLEGDAQQFSYRHSAYSSGNRFVTSAVLRLSPGEPVTIRAKMKDLADRRRSSQPLDLPSAGSTFKRPVGGYAAALIDRCGLKGARVGGAQVSEKHAGFVVNLGGATCRDVLELTDLIRKTVRQRTGIELELEVQRLGC